MVDWKVSSKVGGDDSSENSAASAITVTGEESCGVDSSLRRGVDGDSSLIGTSFSMTYRVP